MEGIVKESVCAAETETTFNGAFRHPRDCHMLKCLSGVLVVWCGVVWCAAARYSSLLW